MERQKNGPLMMSPVTSCALTLTFPRIEAMKLGASFIYKRIRSSGPKEDMQSMCKSEHGETLENSRENSGTNKLGYVQVQADLNT